MYICIYIHNGAQKQRRATTLFHKSNTSLRIETKRAASTRRGYNTVREQSAPIKAALQSCDCCNTVRKQSAQIKAAMQSCDCCNEVVEYCAQAKCSDKSCHAIMRLR